MGSERRIKELQFQQDEDHKNQDRMTELATKLQQKIRTYKKQIEEAEEIAALNLAKFRKAQQELEETEERSKLAEGQMSLARTVPETPWGTSKPDKNNVIRRSEHTQQMKKQKKSSCL